MVEIVTGRGVLEVDDCELVLELYGFNPSEFEKGTVNPRPDFDYRVHSTGLPIEITFPGNRVNLEDVESWVSDYRLSKVKRELNITTPLSRKNDLIDKILEEDMVAYARAEREFQAFFKPHPDIEAMRTERPRPVLVVEAMYDMGRRADLGDEVDAVREMNEDELGINIAKIESNADNGSILVYPLETYLDIDDISSLDFSVGDVARDIAEGITGGRIPDEETAKFNRVMVTCTMLG